MIEREHQGYAFCVVSDSDSTLDGGRPTESQFAKSFEDNHLASKFGYDKVRPHLASLMSSELITRTRATGLLQEHLYDTEEPRRDRQNICGRLPQKSDVEFEEPMNRLIHHYTDIGDWDKQYARIQVSQARISRMPGRDVSAYPCGIQLQP